MVNDPKIDTPKPSETEQSQEAVPRTSKRWYAKKPVIITLLILFFPIGLPLMWKFSPWAKRTKWLVSGVITALLASAFIATYNSTPTISIDNASGGVINTDDAEYELTGSVTSYKETTLKINGVNVPLDVYDFSHKVSLEEGDNTFTLIAVSENGKATKEIAIHRTTQEEFIIREGSGKITDKTNSENNPVDPKQQNAKDKKIELSTSDIIGMRELTKTAIKRVLKAPSTAKFPGDGLIDEPLRDWEYVWANDYENVFYMSSYVDSQNSFSAMIRSQFQTGFKIEGGSYKLVYVYLNGSAIYDKR